MLSFFGFLGQDIWRQKLFNFSVIKISDFPAFLSGWCDIVFISLCNKKEHLAQNLGVLNAYFFLREALKML